MQLTVILLPFGVTLLCFAVFLFSFLREPRKLRNGIYLFCTLMFLALALLFLLASLSGPAAAVAALTAVLAAPVAVAALAVFLIWNGIVMLRREGRRLANLLSLLAGVGILALFGFNAALAAIDWVPLQVLRRSADVIVAYVAFLFVCFVLYALVYGRVRSRKPVDFVVVLGSGLLGGRVPPLLASRLDRGRGLLDAEDAKGRAPVLITSGGRGPNEEVPESHAMADYLTEHGLADERIVREDRSRTTAENLAYSAAIMRERVPDYRCVVVTNNFHVLRTALTARKAAVNGQVVGSRTAPYFWPSAILREFVAVFLDHRVANVTICVLIVVFQVVRVL